MTVALRLAAVLELIILAPVAILILGVGALALLSVLFNSEDE